MTYNGGSHLALKLSNDILILVFLLAGSCVAAVSAQVSPTPTRPSPVASPSSTTLPGPTPTPMQTPAVPAPKSQIDQTRPISLQDALDRANRQITVLTTANINTQIASEDVRQARAAFLPKITAPLDFIYTTPSLVNSHPREPSFISADAVAVYQALMNAEGEIDTSGKLKAILQRNIALVDAARAGKDIARRELEASVVQCYYQFALASVKRRGAESNLRSAEQFEHNQELQLQAGEIAPIDLVRARLQTAMRRDELLQATSDESIAADALRIIIGVGITEPVSVNDLLTQLPVSGEIDRFAESTIRTRPEFAQFEAGRRAAEFEVKAAKADRLPQITYSVSSGFISDSLAPGPVKNHAGIQAIVSVTIPIFDWGAINSKVRQAEFRAKAADAARQIAERQFIQEFYAARQAALLAQERITLLRQSIADAEDNVTTSVSRYRAGEAQLTEVIDAQNTLVAQRIAFYQAIFDYQTAKARLATAAGK